jgi:hypothetical protein
LVILCISTNFTFTYKVSKTPYKFKLDSQINFPGKLSQYLIKSLSSLLCNLLHLVTWSKTRTIRFTAETYWIVRKYIVQDSLLLPSLCSGTYYKPVVADHSLKPAKYMYKKGSMRWKHVSNNVTIFTQNDSVHALKLHL